MISLLFSQAARYSDRSVCNENAGSTCIDPVAFGFATGNVLLEPFRFDEREVLQQAGEVGP